MAEVPTTPRTDWSAVPLFAILLFDVAALIVRSFVEVRLRDVGYATSYAADLSFLIMPPVLLILVYPVLKKHGHLLLTLFRPRDLTLRIVVVGIVLGITLRSAFWGGLIARTAFGFGAAPEQQLPVGLSLLWQCPSSWPFALAILVRVLMIPVIEECVNRGFFLHQLATRNKVLAVIGSALLFAICHNPQTIFTAFVVGLFFAVGTMNAHALWLTTIAHATYNFAVQLDWRCLNGQWNPVETGHAMMGVGVMATTLMLVSLLLAGLLVSRRIIGPRFATR